MKYDIVVIGGGPAGMMAAGRVGELGARVVLLEKNNRLGVKLLITGNGRCNLTNRIESHRKLIEKIGNNGKFLFSALHQFGVDEVIDFFESRGLKTKVEADNRVFPASDRAQDVLRALNDYLKNGKVEIKTDAKVVKIVERNNIIEKIILASGEEVFAKMFIICVGGKAYPLTGSTGDGYAWLENLGHKIVEPRPALTPIIVKERFVKSLEGLSLKGVELKVFKDSRKIFSESGEAIFTADGLSGPLIFELSRKISREFPGELKLVIDFRPSLSLKELDQMYQKIFQEQSNKILRNCLGNFFQLKLIPVILGLSGVDGEKKVNLVTKEDRQKILRLTKEFTLTVKGLIGFDKAMITTGGVELSEVDPKTMKSKIINNLFLAGEILDLDGPTGGYNLQICWSTGYVAGENAVNFIKKV